MSHSSLSQNVGGPHATQVLQQVMQLPCVHVHVYTDTHTPPTPTPRERECPQSPCIGLQTCGTAGREQNSQVIELSRKKSGYGGHAPESHTGQTPDTSCIVCSSHEVCNLRCHILLRCHRPKAKGPNRHLPESTEGVSQRFLSSF